MSKITIKTEFEIIKIAEAGKYVGMFFRELEPKMVAGISTMDIEDLANEFCERYSVHPCFKDVPGYHWAVCASINEEVVHGIPSKTKILKEGDLVTIDMGIKKDGWIGDSATCYLIGENVAKTTRSLYEATKESLVRAIAVAKPGNTLGDIGHAIQSFVEPLGFSVVREYVGHGVGRELHEPPTVYHFGKPKDGLELRPGLVIAIEPMINEGGWETEILEDGWTVVTKDRKLSCQFEHSIAITKQGARILTI